MSRVMSEPVARGDALVEVLLRQRRQARQRAAHLAGDLVQAEQRLQLILEAVALALLAGELEGDAGLVSLTWRMIRCRASFLQARVKACRGANSRATVSSRPLSKQRVDDGPVADGDSRTVQLITSPSRRRASSNGREAVARGHRLGRSWVFLLALAQGLQTRQGPALARASPGLALVDGMVGC